LFLYPHSLTGVLASRNRDVIKRNMAALPAYSLLLGLMALLGYMAIAASQRGIAPLTIDGKPDVNTIVPVLFDRMFPSWFAGIAFAAIGIGALVPAAIMSIAAANLFTRNIYVEYLAKDANHAEQARVSKLASLIDKLGALLVIVLIDPQFSIDLQLIGGVIILQTLPSVGLGLFIRWFHRTGLIAGWIAGMSAGLAMLYTIPNPATNHQHFGGSAFLLSKLGLPWNVPVYAGLLAVIVNLIVVVIGTLIARAARVPEGADVTAPPDYFADEGDPKRAR
jgi:SSS family solute:Na+ symporter